MSALEEFKKSIKRITQSGMHDFNEAVKRTPEGFILTKMERSIDYYHWNCEYTKIEEWQKMGGQGTDPISETQK